jgi:hypothetical protein
VQHFLLWSATKTVNWRAQNLLHPATEKRATTKSVAEIQNETPFSPKNYGQGDRVILTATVFVALPSLSHSQ